jgi:hypothetical protein
MRTHTVLVEVVPQPFMTYDLLFVFLSRSLQACCVHISLSPAPDPTSGACADVHHGTESCPPPFSAMMRGSRYLMTFFYTSSARPVMMTLPFDLHLEIDLFFQLSSDRSQTDEAGTE